MFCDIKLMYELLNVNFEINSNWLKEILWFLNFNLVTSIQYVYLYTVLYIYYILSHT